MAQEKEYYAFISYKREDEKWAKWLQRKLEHYRFPANLNGRTDLPKNIRPTFRDVTDSTPGLLAEVIDKALRNSEWLIVVCSPRSAKSPWVCKETQTFIDLGRADHIIPFVVEGNPFSNDPNTECYPEALLDLTGSKELLAADIKEMGRDAAVVKVVAKMFGLRFDTLWQRYKREQKRRRMIMCSIALLFILLVGGFLFYAASYYDKKIADYCKTGIRIDDGLFSVQQKLLEYQKYSWLLKKETQSILKNTIYVIDYNYNIYPLPVTYTYTSNGGEIDQLRFRYDDNQIIIGTGIYETSGILDYKRGKFQCFEHYAGSVEYIHNSDTIITCGMGVFIYDKNANQITKYDVDGYGMQVSLTHNHFICKKMNEITSYNLNNGNIIASKVFEKDILCYSYNKYGDYIAVATIDSVLSLMNVETGEIFLQQKKSLPIVAITAANESNSFFAAYYGDSIRVKEVTVDSLEHEVPLFTIPTHSSYKNKLSYTTGDYLAFTNGRFYALYNMQTRQMASYADVSMAFRAEMDAVAMSPSGTKICYAINGKVYVTEIKDEALRKQFPIQHFGFSDVIGPAVSNVCIDDSTIVMAVIKKDGGASVGMYDLYSGRQKNKLFETSKPVWRLVPLPTANHVAVALEELNRWAIVDLTTGSMIKEFAVDTLSTSSPLMLTANNKYLIGLYTGTYNFRHNDNRCIWSATTYNRVDSVYFYSGPLQDGEHMYNSDTIFTYPKRNEIVSSTNINFIEEGELFDGDEMAYVSTGSLFLYNLKNNKMRYLNLRQYGQGDAKDYKLVGFKDGFAILFNRTHLMIIDTENNDLVLQKTTTPNECITSAVFYNNKSRILLTTNWGLCIYDLLDYNQLIDVWEKKLLESM